MTKARPMRSHLVRSRDGVFGFIAEADQDNPAYLVRAGSTRSSSLNADGVRAAPTETTDGCPQTSVRWALDWPLLRAPNPDLSSERGGIRVATVVWNEPPASGNA